MTSIHVDLDDAHARRLQQRASDVGISAEQLAAEALTNYLDHEPASGDGFAFVASFSSDRLRGDKVDEALAGGFGR